MPLKLSVAVEFADIESFALLPLLNDPPLLDQVPVYVTALDVSSMRVTVPAGIDVDPPVEPVEPEPDVEPLLELELLPELVLLPELEPVLEPVFEPEPEEVPPPVEPVPEPVLEPVPLDACDEPFNVRIRLASASRAA